MSDVPGGPEGDASTDAPTPSRWPGGQRPPTWQLAVAAGAVVVTVVSLLAILLHDDGGDATVATGVTSSSTSSPTTDPGFQAPPSQVPVTTTSTTTTAAPTTTLPPTTAAPTTTTTAPPPTTVPMEVPRPGPQIDSSQGDHGDLQDALDSARSRWASQLLPEGYRYDTRVDCFCPRSRNRIVVAPDGTVADQQTLEGGPEDPPPTIDDVFDELQAAIDADPFLIQVRFDVDRGYPVSYFVDYQAMLADEEDGRTIEAFAPNGG